MLSPPIGTLRHWEARRNARTRGGQSVRSPAHAYGAFHYIKPFQCIIYFCVSHLRTRSAGSRATKTGPRAIYRGARIGPVYIILTCDFQAWQRQTIAFTTRLYCERPHRHFVDFHTHYETLSSLKHETLWKIYPFYIHFSNCVLKNTIQIGTLLALYRFDF